MYEEIARNKRNSVILVIAFSFFITLFLTFILSFVFHSFSFLWTIISLIFVLIFVLIQYYSGSRMILSITGARKATKEENAYLVNSVESLSIAAGILQPEIYVIDDTALNAFATGRDPKHSAIVITTGLIKKMNRLELEGVIAHELSHIKNYDIRFMLLIVALVGITTLISDLFLRMIFHSGHHSDSKGSGAIILIVLIIAIILRILTPIIGLIVQLAVSRQREYLADASAALLTRYPDGLAGALEKIKNDKEPTIESANMTTASLFISSPFKTKSGIFKKLFSTHPDINERIKRLKEM